MRSGTLLQWIQWSIMSDSRGKKPTTFLRTSMRLKYLSSSSEWCVIVIAFEKKKNHCWARHDNVSPRTGEGWSTQKKGKKKKKEASYQSFTVVSIICATGSVTAFGEISHQSIPQQVVKARGDWLLVSKPNTSMPRLNLCSRTKCGATCSW